MEPYEFIELLREVPPEGFEFLLASWELQEIVRPQDVHEKMGHKGKQGIVGKMVDNWKKNWKKLVRASSFR